MSGIINGVEEDHGGKDTISADGTNGSSSSRGGGGGNLNLESRFNQTLRSVQGLLIGRSFPGKALLSRKTDPPNQFQSLQSARVFERNNSDNYFRPPIGNEEASFEDVKNPQSVDNINITQRLLIGRSFPGKALLSRKTDPPNQFQSLQSARVFERNNSDNYFRPPIGNEEASFEDVKNPQSVDNINITQRLSCSSMGNASTDAFKPISGGRATDSTRLAKFTRELSTTAVVLDKLRELGWNGIPPFMRPNVWRLLLGYASPNSDRKERALARKRLEYVDCISQYHDIPDSDRSDDEINMLRQIAVDCPRTVPHVAFFQQAQVQKSLERILYTWAIRHPASGYVQGINDLVTPFLVVFLSEHLEGSMDNWLVSDLSPQIISNMEADCYWCLSKLLDGMQDNYTFAQPGIQRLVFKLKELVCRIDEPVYRHMEEQGLEFLQFAFRWFNCLLIREIPFHLVNRLWDTYLAEGDALPEFLVYISASLILTWSDKLQKLEFQEMVMFLQHLPTQNWSDQELEMVLSRAYMWHTMFKSSPRHLVS